MFIVFQLPDGTRTSARKLDSNATVLFVKVMLEDEYNLAAGAHRLVHNGAELIDPLSLCDVIDADPEQQILVVVESSTQR